MNGSHTPQLYSSPISLPESESGDFQIEHVLMSGRVPIVGMRQAFMRGVVPVLVQLDSPLKTHELSEDGRVWMTDRPEELNQIGEVLWRTQPRGRILVGGLGLGILSRTLYQRSYDVQITIVEISQDVIDLALPAGDKSRETRTLREATICADILPFLRDDHRAGPFDFYLLDTWTGTGEGTWWDVVLPLRRAIRNRFGRKPRIHCWAEDIMWGQVRSQLLSNHPKHWHYVGPLRNMSERDAKWFFQEVGNPKWEKKYGASVTLEPVAVTV